MSGVHDRVAGLTPDAKRALLARLLRQRSEQPRRAALSSGQQRLWLLDRLRPGNAIYVISRAFRLTGALDVDALERALAEVVRRHEALRTVFAEREGEPEQVVAPAAELRLAVEELGGLPAAEREAAALRRVREESVRPFDLERGPLFRAGLLRLDAEEHVLALCMHHIVSDGWSMGVLLRELEALYGAFARGEPSPLAELPIQYADYAVWQRDQLTGAALEEQLAYWRERLAGAPAVLELPTDRARPAEQGFRGALERRELPGELLGELKGVARREGATLFMVLAAAFQLLLSRWSGQEEVVVGTPVAGRTRAETEGLIGFFVNTLALRGDLGGEPSFRELLGRVRESTLGAFAHQDLPFEKLLEELAVERSLRHSPVFQVMINLFDRVEADAHLPGLRVDALPPPPDPGAKFDLTLYVQKHAGGIVFELVYNADLFTRARAAEMLGQLHHLLAQAARDPDGRIGGFSLVTAEARAVLP
ncbi:MAG TPA: condensation domain-containing protein, partial [Longimicrobiaceae bacterium]|nr:condensation domain-containing protein [Longimicrobiaceae bacterium]